jgi:hypothetical protein
VSCMIMIDGYGDVGLRARLRRNRYDEVDTLDGILGMARSI